MYRGMRFEYLGKKLIHFHRSCSRYAEIPPGILSFPRRTEDLDGGRRISIARIRFLNKRLGVCSAQGTGEDSTGGSRLSNATRVLLYSRRKLREKWGGGWWARPSFAGGPSEFERRKRERESGVCCKQADVATMEKEETILFFWIRGRKRYGGGGGSIMILFMARVTKSAFVLFDPFLNAWCQAK